MSALHYIQLVCFLDEGHANWSWDYVFLNPFYVCVLLWSGALWDGHHLNDFLFYLSIWSTWRNREQFPIILQTHVKEIEMSFFHFVYNYKY